MCSRFSGAWSTRIHVVRVRSAAASRFGPEGPARLTRPTTKDTTTGRNRIPRSLKPPARLLRAAPPVSTAGCSTGLHCSDGQSLKTVSPRGYRSRSPDASKRLKHAVHRARWSAPAMSGLAHHWLWNVMSVKSSSSPSCQLSGVSPGPAMLPWFARTQRFSTGTRSVDDLPVHGIIRNAQRSWCLLLLSHLRPRGVCGKPPTPRERLSHKGGFTFRESNYVRVRTTSRPVLP